MISSPVLIIARLTLREAARRRLLLAVVVLTLLLIGVSAWGFARITALPCDYGARCSSLETKARAAILVTLISFMYSFVFALGAVFMAAPVIASETESGVALAMLPRPIRRSDVVLGKWLGLATLIAGYASATTGMEFFAVRVLVGYMPPHPFAAILFLVGQSFVMLTLALLFSTRLAPMTGGIVALVFFGLAWIGGIAHGIAVVLGSESVRNVALATRIVLPSDGLWRGALYSVEPSFFSGGGAAGGRSIDNPFFVLGPPQMAFIVWAAVWIVLVLGLAVLSFQRREI